MNSEDDHTLIRRYQRGDGQAFERFVARHQDRVFRTCWGLLGNSADAEEAAQEVFLRSIKGMRRFLFKAQPTTWLTRTAHNVCHEMRRRNPREATAVDYAELLAALPDERANPESLHAGPGLPKATLYRWLAALPDRQREVVVCRILEEMTIAQTSVVMSCREGTVKALLFKALQGLRKMADSENQITESPQAGTGKIRQLRACSG